ncbi:YgdI/YgdR family lipoprotein [Ostreibacterium oceani]|uniref:YgdI/YgdR family lipoprotein n=1 Tax=Ostreibacterium oceani TaxID=2654998 RepID=UPI001C40604C|nr:YgdI/YgdR family lipoprotein [Ostreibacterium oceani]
MKHHLFRSLCILLSTLALLTGCSNPFSNERTVYRIETTNGQRFYSDKEPTLKDDRYFIRDLDGNRYELSKDAIYLIEPYTRRK